MFQNLSEFAAHLRAFIATAVTPEDEVFDRLALELFALQFEHNLPYRRLCAARGISPRHARHWRELPALPTSAFKELEVTCLSATERGRVFHSSGTTELKPSRHFHSAASLALYEASLRPWFHRHLLADGWVGRWLFLTPPPAETLHSSLIHMFATVAQEYADPGAVYLAKAAVEEGWQLDCSRTESELAAACAERRPVLLGGTAFSFVHLLDHLVGQGRRFALPTGSRILETGGYKGRSRSLPKAELHHQISHYLGVPPEYIVCEYGMCELGSQAYDRIAGLPSAEAPRFRFPPWCRVLVTSPETGREVAEGQPGLLRIFDLANVFSLLAVQTEDLAIRRGDGFELLGRAAQAEPRGCSLQPGK
jgi:hypothetical protein